METPLQECREPRHHQHACSHGKLQALPCSLLLAAIAQVAGDEELTTFVVHVQPQQEGHVLATADDRKAWYKSFLPENCRLVHAYHHVASGFAARLTREELDTVSAMPGFAGVVPDRMIELQTMHTPLFLGLDNARERTRRRRPTADRDVMVGPESSSA
ncbi:hypothetical protein BAE44_0006382 [Dichanthelium oligosanthes]|uniref:Inhibitor I9 domain-containing protein n=1 Tax=Dichanthelium oligosanthes TaxID=888268 RepID=A0A1E5W5H0_9POAL|nr:hypothetical protein BAE44_0006382 [Dichanthelium oligosanthes]